MRREMIYTVKIEQTYHQPNRMKYIAQTDSFVEKNVKSISYVKNVRQPYGWIRMTSSVSWRRVRGGSTS